MQFLSSGAAGEGQSCAVAAHLAYFLIERQLGSVRRDALLSGLAGAQLLTWTSSPRPFAQAAAGTPTGHALEQSGAELRNFFFQTGNLSPASGLLGELDSAGLVAKADSYSRWHSSSNGPHQATSRLAQDSAAWSRLDTDSRLPPQPAGRLNEATAAGQASSRRGEADKERRRPDRRGVLFNGSINRHKSPLLPTLWIALTLLVLASDVLC
ncbi:unnamed protein product [Protopolystoma xenopodis]|uniref:Uncharacterized protein n=1 Tax=Protopolystoma xenopodis TaxID=117903 RepID=A0A448WBJ6_9PLAT|nr:unnamed protein product [Protopolystoma xenopodis]